MPLWPKLSPEGNALVYCTRLGGSGWDAGTAIAVDSSGAAYVTGETSSSNFPTLNPLQGSNGGGFVAKLNPEGNALVYSTFLGGISLGWGTGIAVDGAGAAYITGGTSSSKIVVKLNSQRATP